MLWREETADARARYRDMTGCTEAEANDAIAAMELLGVGAGKWEAAEPGPPLTLAQLRAVLALVESGQADAAVLNVASSAGVDAERAAAFVKRLAGPKKAGAGCGGAAFVALGLLLLLAFAAPASAHPSWSVVRDDARKVVYYSDLTQVFSIDARFERRVAVPRVHAHELRIDAAGNLYGEDAPVNGRYRVWKRSPDGTVSDVIADRPGSRDDYGFVEGAGGALYWTKCATASGASAGSCVVRRRLANGLVETAARGAPFGQPLNFLSAMADGRVLVADGPDLKVIAKTGAVETYLRQVTRSRGRFAIMGFHSLPFDALYLAAFDDRAILRVGPDRVVSVEARSKAPWSPTGVLRTPDGLWILEYDRARARLRFVDAKGRERIFPAAN